MKLEKLLASSCRQKILKELSKTKTVNIMKLVQNINSTYVEVKRNLKILEGEGVLTDKHIGRLRMIKLNRENPKTTILLQALKILNTQTETKTEPPYPPKPERGDLKHQY